jgi:hypothetical protein
MHVFFCFFCLLMGFKPPPATPKSSTRHTRFRTTVVGIQHFSTLALFIKNISNNKKTETMTDEFSTISFFTCAGSSGTRLSFVFQTLKFNRATHQTLCYPPKVTSPTQNPKVKLGSRSETLLPAQSDVADPKP